MAYVSPQQAEYRGRRSVRQVLTVLRGLRRDYPWIRKAIEATPEQDREGIDVVVTLDSGDVWVQVKSSVTGANEFRAHRPAFNGIVVIAEKNDVALRHRLIQSLRRFRDNQLVVEGVCESSY